MKMNYLAFDIGGTNVKYAAVTKDGKILVKGKFKSPQTSLNEMIKSMVGVHKKLAKEYSFKGIAISTPGAPNNHTGIIEGGSALPYLHGPNFRDILLRETGLYMYAENDAKSAALCEVWVGAAKDVQDSLFIIIGTGIGGAVVKDKKIHQGVNRLAGEVGYMILDGDFSTGTFKTFSELGATGSIIRYVAKKRGVAPDTLTGEKLFDDAKNGDTDCIEAIEIFYESIAVSIFNLMYFYNPEIIVIGGAISSREELIDNITEKLEYIKSRFTSNVSNVNPPIVKCQYEGDANLLGAVYNYIQWNTKSKDSY